MVAALSLVLAALQGSLAHDGAPLEPPRTAIGAAVFGVPVLMVLASMTMTAEYRSGMIRTTFVATPNRAQVLVAKAVVVSVFSAVFAALMVIGAVGVARLFDTSTSAANLSSTLPEMWHLVGAVALYAALAAVLGVGVGALLRAGPGAVAVLLLWPLVVEPLLGNLPDVGSEVGPYLPFGNIFIVHRGAVAVPDVCDAVGPARIAGLFRGDRRGRLGRGDCRGERARRLISPDRLDALGRAGRRRR